MLPGIFFAEIGVPSAGQCLAVLAPVLGIGFFYWLMRNVDLLIARLLPTLEWEKQLGWLNITAERRAVAVLRWCRNLIYAILAVALYGVVQGAVVISQLREAQDPIKIGELTGELPLPLICVGVWLVYLGFELFPKLRRRYEDEELAHFRVERAQLERTGDDPVEPSNEETFIRDLPAPFPPRGRAPR